jgi:hypothetical protein
MEKEKPCDTCLILAKCSSVCDDFLLWCVKADKSSFQSHPNFPIATITSHQITWINEQTKKYREGNLNFLFPN